MDMQELARRYEEARQYKDRWLGQYQNLYNYVLPDRDAFNVKWNYQDQGKPTTNSIWDATATLAANERANEMQSLLLPHGRTWGSYVLPPHLFEENQIEAIKPQVDEANSRIMFYIHNSNLTRVVYGSNLDLVGGMGVIYVDSPSDEEPLRFSSIPSVSTYIEPTSEDVINNMWVEVKMIGYRILATFPKITGKLKENIMADPNKTFIVQYGQVSKDKNSFYFYATLPEIDKFRPIFEKETSHRQLIVFRDVVRPGESEGRGIGLDLLPLIVDLNHMVRDDRKNKAFKADPPMFYDNKMFNPWSVRSWSGAMIARQPGARNPLEAMQMPVYPEVMQHEEMLREQIRKGFRVEPLGEMQNTTKTATEISIRENRAQRSSTTNMSRIINEQPKQIFETCAKILAERRLIAKNGSIGEIKTEKLKFDFQSPLFDLQKEENINSLVNNLQIKQQWLGEGAALASIDMGEVNEFLTDNSNLPSKLFKDKQAMNDLMKQMGQGQQQDGQQAQQLPSPTTGASDVQLPQQPQVQF